MPRLRGGHSCMRERARGYGGSTGLGGGHRDVAVDAKRLLGFLLGHEQTAEVVEDTSSKTSIPQLLRQAQCVAQQLFGFVRWSSGNEDIPKAAQDRRDLQPVCSALGQRQRCFQALHCLSVVAKRMI